MVKMNSVHRRLSVLSMLEKISMKNKVYSESLTFLSASIFTVGKRRKNEFIPSMTNLGNYSKYFNFANRLISSSRREHADHTCRILSHKFISRLYFGYTTSIHI